MEKSTINLNYRIEVLSKGLDKEKIINSIQLVSNNPELVITNRINSDVFVESQEKEPSQVDPVYVDYFRFFKKN